jgi:hypothetical protein
MITMTIRNTVGYLVTACIFVILFLIRIERNPHQVFATVSIATTEQPQADRTQYVGDAACTPCHEKEAQTYLHTAHHLTSQIATKGTVLGPFTNGKGLLTISNPEGDSSDPHLYFQMESREDGLYQTAVAEMGTQKLSRSERMDIVIGSGVRGQTYLYWLKNQLFELPVSYWTDGHQWINSPGYKDGTSNFARRADPRCIECHASYIHALSTDPQTNLYDPATLETGISCEVCHGPGKLHSLQQQSHKTDATSTSPSITNPATLNRDRQIDQCALCHNGTARKELIGAFSYVPGQPLDRYLAPPSSDPSDQPDVHGNQVGLLEKSRCFLSSPSMTCSTCHNIHAPKRPAADYSPRCLTCHRWQSCGESKKIGAKIVRDCIDCHMPLQQTNAIVSVTAGRVLRTSIRTHWIKVYPQPAP